MENEGLAGAGLAVDVSEPLTDRHLLAKHHPVTHGQHRPYSGQQLEVGAPRGPPLRRCGCVTGGSSGRNSAPGRSCFGAGPGSDLIGRRLCQRSGPSRGRSIDCALFLWLN